MEETIDLLNCVFVAKIIRVCCCEDQFVFDVVRWVRGWSWTFQSGVMDLLVDDVLRIISLDEPSF